MNCSPPDDSVEVPLDGGTANRGRVVRIADTVRRPTRPTSPSTVAALRHLEAVGFDGAPRYLGVDDQGREVLSFVPGITATVPYPDWALTDAALVSVARLLHRLHDAMADFDPSGHTWPGPVPAAFRTGLVTHNDPNLDNVVFRNGDAVALIDFDLASPGSRVWEVAAAARFWVPLRLPEDTADSRSGRELPRLRAFVDAYGLDGTERAALPAALLANHDWLYGIVREAAEGGHDAFAAYWDEGGGSRAARARRWCEVNLDRITAVLGG